MLPKNPRVGYCTLMYVTFSTPIYMRARISVRIDVELKKRMSNISINWSKYIREAIETKLREEEMRRAAEKMDEIAAATNGTWSGANEIRKRRDVLTR
jgi:predicted DNA-binding protein